MRVGIYGDVLRVWLYAGAVVLLGTWISPVIYNLGKALAEVSSSKQTNELFEQIAAICRRADFPDFFVASLIGLAAILFVPFVSSLRGGRFGGSAATWRIRLPQGPRVLGMGQRLVKNQKSVSHASIGFGLVVVMFSFLAGILFLLGLLQWKGSDGGFVKAVPRWLIFAVGFAAVQEVLFRGIAMGIFLRVMRPAAALGLSAVLFALVHFLNPPSGLDVRDPDAAGVGFELLDKIITQFAEPHVVLGGFMPMLALGMVLAFARWRTASLWLPIGLHSGWIFINGLVGSFAMASHPESAQWIIFGIPLKQGLVPLVGIFLVGVLSKNLIKARDESPNIVA